MNSISVLWRPQDDRPGRTPLDLTLLTFHQREDNLKSSHSIIMPSKNRSSLVGYCLKTLVCSLPSND
jgi:hypothetical protein